MNGAEAFCKHSMLMTLHIMIITDSILSPIIIEFTKPCYHGTYTCMVRRWKVTILT